MSIRTILLCGALGAACAACAQFKPPAEGGSSSGGGGGDGDPCARRAQIEDGEDGDDQVLTRGGRGGYLYTFADEKGSSISPQGDDVKPVPGGADSGYALHMKGHLTDNEEAYAGIGFSFKEPKKAYDATQWRGVSFVARRGEHSVGNLRVKLPDANTDPDGKVCTDCFNDFGISFQVGPEWTRYEVAFDDLKQEADWGKPRPDKLDPAHLYGLQWQVSARNVDYDFWIDDVAFLGCPEAGQK